MSGPESDERRGFFSRPTVRRILSRIVIAVGIVLALIALVSARYGLLFAAVILVGLGAALGPARLRR
ncbi:hypothetical protein MUN74_10870 [Agromyces endophyticus]|uniref:hypothetical protein n=1 Tax=Agromyces sp. H17E-10 TaxID=2932244 RepID=UPI001FD260F9|nr:hypothetical protein [Agromyces sp. H17E-10]UOQ87805.1 hypothetical protein MUN74_10870 [Agromyces sp. H17E-10]